MSYFQPRSIELYTSLVTDTTTQYDIQQSIKDQHELNTIQSNKTDDRLICGYTGVSAYLSYYNNYNIYIQSHQSSTPSTNTTQLTQQQRMEKKQLKRKRRNQYILNKHIDRYNQLIQSTADQQIKQWSIESYKTLFIGRLQYNITIEQLKYEMRYYGKIINIIIPRHNQMSDRLIPVPTNTTATDTTINHTNNHKDVATGTLNKHKQRKLDKIRSKQSVISEQIKSIKKSGDKSNKHNVNTMKQLQLQLKQYDDMIQSISNQHINNTSQCGYAFIEFEHSSDLTAAYKDLDGRTILQHRVVVDVERGRTVKNWLPRRLGGGKGYTRLGHYNISQYYPGREYNNKYKDDPRFTPHKPTLSKHELQRIKSHKSRVDIRTSNTSARSSHHNNVSTSTRYDDRSGGLRHGSGEKRYRDYDSHSYREDDRRYEKRR